MSPAKVVDLDTSADAAAWVHLSAWRGGQKARDFFIEFNGDRSESAAIELTFRTRTYGKFFGGTLAEAYAAFEASESKSP